jgi:8-oxo-dGTP pyrophosphatase MutT (NUDIX family)
MSSLKFHKLTIRNKVSTFSRAPTRYNSTTMDKPKEVASLAVFNQDGRMLWGKRRDNARFTMPGGHLDENEHPYHGARRELKEETGINIDNTPLEHLGSEPVVTHSGKNYIIHAFKVVVPKGTKTTMGADPDKEVHRWDWHNVEGGLPNKIKSNLHSPRNIVLEKLGLAPEEPLAKAIIDEPLIKSPFQFEVKNWSGARNLSGQTNSSGYNVSSQKVLGMGSPLYHHSWGDGEHHEHVLSRSPHPPQTPEARNAIVGIMQTRHENHEGGYDSEASPTVKHSAIRHGERGKGYGKLLYTLAAAHHGALKSDSQVSARATHTWRSLVNTDREHIQGSEGSPSYQESRHEIDWHGPDIKGKDTVHYNPENGHVEAHSGGWKPAEEHTGKIITKPTAHDYAELHGQHHFDFLEGPKITKSHPNAYSWGDESKKEEDLKKANEHPHIAAHGPAIPNEQAGGNESGQFHSIMSHYGTVNPGHTTDLKFYHGLEHAEPKIDAHLKEHGYEAYLAGGKHGKPDLQNRNYNTKHLMIYDPSAGSGGDFGHEAYTSAWRKSHEKAHADTLPEVNKIYGEGRRLGKLGVRTPHEMKRAAHWEWLATHRQRDILAGVGHHVSDHDFHRELNTVMGDAVHRAVTGKFTDPNEMGFHPHSHKVPLEHALTAIDDHANKLGLRHPHDTLAALRASAGAYPELKKNTETKDEVAEEIPFDAAVAMHKKQWLSGKHKEWGEGESDHHFPFSHRHDNQPFVRVLVPTKDIDASAGESRVHKYKKILNEQGPGRMGPAWVTAGRTFNDGSIHRDADQSHFSALDGNHRVKAAQELGHQNHEVIMPKAHWEAYKAGKIIRKSDKTEELEKIRSPRSGHTIKQLRQLKEMNWHNPDTGTEISEGEGEEHLHRLEENRAEKKVISLTSARKKRQAKEAISKPEEWDGIFSLKKGQITKYPLHTGLDATIIKNPSPAQAKNLHAKSKDGTMRYFGDPHGNLHMWDAHDLTHEEVMTHLGVEHNSDNYAGAGTVTSPHEAESVARNFLKKSEDVLEKGKNAREQRERVFGGWKTTPKSPKREKQIAALGNLAQRRYGMQLERSPGKKNHQGKVIDKPTLDNPKGTIQHIGNPDSVAHEFAHVELVPHHTTLPVHQHVMDKEWGQHNVTHGYKQQARTRSEYETSALENPIRRQAGLPAHQKQTNEPKGKRDMAADVPGKKIVHEVKTGKKVKRLTATSANISPEARERFDAQTRGETKFTKEKGWHENPSVHGKINRRARVKAKDTGRKDAKTLLRSETVVEDAMNKSVKGAIIGAALAAAGAAPVHQVTEPAPLAHAQLKSELQSISQIESSGGKNKNHEMTHVGLNAGMTAGGSTGLMPLTIQGAIQHSKFLHQKYGHMLSMKPDQITAEINKNPEAETEIANEHWSHLSSVFKSPARRAYAWRNGINATQHANDQEVYNHPYVQHFLKLREGTSMKKSSQFRNLDYDAPHPDKIPASETTMYHKVHGMYAIGHELHHDSEGKLISATVTAQNGKKVQGKPEHVLPPSVFKDLKKTLSIGHGAMGAPTSLTGGAAAAGIEATHPAYESLQGSPSVHRMSFDQMKKTELNKGGGWSSKKATQDAALRPKSAKQNADSKANAKAAFESAIAAFDKKNAPKTADPKVSVDPIEEKLRSLRDKLRG